jgi:hypothetical protein
MFAASARQVYISVQYLYGSYESNPPPVQLLFGGSKGFRTFNTGYCAQDDWRVTENFQMNLGVRYEYSPPLRGGFNVNSSNPFGPFNAPQQPMFAQVVIPSGENRPGHRVFRHRRRN